MKEPINIFEQVTGVLKANEQKAFNENSRSTRFLRITESSDTEIIGRNYPQTKKIDLNAAHSLKFHKLPEKSCNFGKIEIYSTSKLLANI